MTCAAPKRWNCMMGHRGRKATPALSANVAQSVHKAHRVFKVNKGQKVTLVRREQPAPKGRKENAV